MVKQERRRGKLERERGGRSHTKRERERERERERIDGQTNMTTEYLNSIFIPEIKLVIYI